MNAKQAKRIRKFLQKQLDTLKTNLTWRDRAEEWKLVRSIGSVLNETVPPNSSIYDNCVTGIDLLGSLESTVKVHRDVALQMRLAANSPRGMYRRIKVNVSATRSA